MIVSAIRQSQNAKVPEQRLALSRRERTDNPPDYWLDIALEDSFPCSDPISSMRAD